MVQTDTKGNKAPGAAKLVAAKTAKRIGLGVNF
jgi:hypothetical protein